MNSFFVPSLSVILFLKILCASWCQTTIILYLAGSSSQLRIPIASSDLSVGADLPTFVFNCGVLCFRVVQVVAKLKNFANQLLLKIG